MVTVVVNRRAPERGPKVKPPQPWASDEERRAAFAHWLYQHDAIYRAAVELREYVTKCIALAEEPATKPPHVLKQVAAKDTAEQADDAAAGLR